MQFTKLQVYINNIEKSLKFYHVVGLYDNLIE